jgi:hypothetical protein
MRQLRAVWRPALALLVFTVIVIATIRSAQPPSRVMPGSFTGYAFDTCDAPSQSAMDAWQRHSPYSGIGIYIAGANRGCSGQPALSDDWVSAQSEQGWRLLPITVGRQVPCSTTIHGPLISDDPADGYATAREQGATQAQDTVDTSEDLDIAKGSTQWFDLEHFEHADQRCRASTLAFLSSWTSELHHLGYRSGVYSNANSGIRLLDKASRDAAQPDFRAPDQVWFAEWNGRADVASRHLSADAWMPHARVHQFAGNTDETYGGVTINIDRNYMDVGHGSVAPPPARYCGVRVDFAHYRTLRPGDHNRQVAAAQCLLRHAELYDGRVTGRFDQASQSAVRGFQRGHPPLGVTGTMDSTTWTALLADGRTPVLKYGSASNAVRRLQRALTATRHSRLPVTGVFAARTQRAVARYQHRHGVERTGVVNDGIWRLLQTGNR